jgi:hypothetical protein
MPTIPEEQPPQQKKMRKSKNPNLQLPKYMFIYNPASVPKIDTEPSPTPSPPEQSPMSETDKEFFKNINFHKTVVVIIHKGLRQTK